MKKLINLLLPFLFLMIGIAACEEDETIPAPVNKLKAVAGADQTVAVNTLVTLNGSASLDGNGKTFDYYWILKSRPAGSTASLNEAATAAPRFTPDVAGTYVVELKISNKIWFNTDEVSITATATGTDGGTADPEAIMLSEAVSHDVVLENIFEDPAVADYIVVGDITVSAKLVLEPGVVVAFEQDKSLKVVDGGALVARGTADNKIIFMGKTRASGFWKGILISSSSTYNELEHVLLTHAGSSPFSEMPGIDVKAGVALLGTAAPGAALKVSNSEFVDNGGYGMFVQGVSELKAFNNNSFYTNASAAMYVPARQLHKLDAESNFTGYNGYDGVVTGGTLQLSGEVTWPDFNDGSTYLVSSDISVESGLKIAEGAAFKFMEGIMMQVVENGYLTAVGTASNKTIFTTSSDNPYRYWGGILFNTASSANRLEYAEVSYAGGKALPGFDDLKSNVAVGTAGKLYMQNTSMWAGQGLGLLAFTDKGAQLNADVASTNSFHGFEQNPLRLKLNQTTTDPEVPSIEVLAGEWVDGRSMAAKAYSIDEKFYDRAAGQWFRGAGDPWSMNPKTGFGIKIAADGSYTWIIAESHPMTGCGTSYSAEYLLGKVSIRQSYGVRELHFRESYWRDFFYNACDTSQNVDWEVTPGELALKYQISRMNYAGVDCWVLKIINPDNTFFEYYKPV
ncbi:hypothetical protein [Cesiribacter sp. SM1]|uniref:PKD domain-containing protein n=1 Tax=Cesiribacter sp. SM1 TaxID=2861196 RepID=UPI001CD67BEC|nr:hypothetical protein [Cesiribacter sp. SM1]